MLTVEEHTSLKDSNTFGIDCRAAMVVTVSDRSDIDQLYAMGLLNGKHLVLGGGSNVLLPDCYSGTAILMRNKGLSVLSDTGGKVEVEVEAGEVWDSFVKKSVALGWHGLENLVAIPGTVGAAAVGNIGAYGAEVSDVITKVTAFDKASGRWLEIDNQSCNFAYRDSLFKHREFIVGSVTFCLSRTYEPNTSYSAVASIVERLGHTPTATEMVAAIEETRWSKLPRPEEKGSAGSFFKNPVVAAEKYEQLKAQYPDMVAFPVAEGYKLAAGWLIDRAGWKGRTLGRCGVYEKQALVLVNHGGCTGEEVRLLAKEVAGDVCRKYGVTLEPETIFVEE